MKNILNLIIENKSKLLGLLKLKMIRIKTKLLGICIVILNDTKKN